MRKGTNTFSRHCKRKVYLLCEMLMVDILISYMGAVKYDFFSSGFSAIKKLQQQQKKCGNGCLTVKISCSSAGTVLARHLFGRRRPRTQGSSSFWSECYKPDQRRATAPGRRPFCAITQTLRAQNSTAVICQLRA